MIRLQALSKVYPEKVKVLDAVQLELKPGEFFYVLGGTGAGKSTLLRLLAIEEMPTSGLLSIFDYDITQANKSVIQSIRQNVGYIPQQARLIGDLTVFENIALGAELTGKSSMKAELRHKIYELLDKLNLIGLRDTEAYKLSGGESQRVAVARALIREPKLLIADEPTGAQDLQNAWAVMDVIHRAHTRGSTVLVATHDREIVRRLRKPCATLGQGKIRVENYVNY